MLDFTSKTRIWRTRGGSPSFLRLRANTRVVSEMRVQLSGSHGGVDQLAEKYPKHFARHFLLLGVRLCKNTSVLVIA